MFENSVYSFQLVTQETMLLHTITFVYSTYKCILTFWLSRKLVFKKPVYSFQLVVQEAMLQCMPILCQMVSRHGVLSLMVVNFRFSMNKS